MIKSISYGISVAKLGFSYSDFEYSSRNLELVPNISMDVVYPNFEVVRDIQIHYTPNGFLVGINSVKLSFEQIRELEHYINHNKRFQEDFEIFMQEIRECGKVGFSIEKNKV